MWSHKILFIDLAIAIVVCLIVIVVTVFMSISWVHDGTIKSSVYWQELKPQLKTGDIFIFSSSAPELRMFMLSKWSHIGVVVKNDNQILLLESDVTTETKARGIVDVMSGNRDKNGVKLVDLEEKLRKYTGNFYYRSLEWSDDVINKEAKYFKICSDYKATLDFIAPRYSHLVYQSRMGFWVKQYAKTRKVNPLCFVGQDKQFQKYGAIFCSELATDFFKNMGIVKEKIFPNNILPKHYAQDSVYNIFNKGWSFSKQKLVLLSD